jgi:hypothetical protein
MEVAGFTVTMTTAQWCGCRPDWVVSAIDAVCRVRSVGALAPGSVGT